MERSDGICHLALYLYYCGRTINWGCPMVQFMSIFRISFQMVNINTILCNPNLIYSKSIFSCSRGCRQSVEPY